jgi:hypothetical protein
VYTDLISAARQDPAVGRLIIDFSSPYEAICYTPNGVRGRLGALSELGNKTLLFTRICQSLESQGYAPGHIDVRAKDGLVWSPRAG